MNSSSHIEINHTPIWAQLHQHQRATRYMHMRGLFDADPLRFKKMHIAIDGILLDYSKNRITQDTIDLLTELAQEANLQGWMDKMRSGAIINLSEKRAALHIALRQPETANVQVNGHNVIPDIHRELKKALAFANTLYEQTHLGFSGQPITDVVNLGIGGSDLGPQMLTQALTPYHGKANVHFVANVDSTDLLEKLTQLNPQTTLFIIASKSFSTPETLLNAQTARKWFLQQGQKSDIAKHFVAVSSNSNAAIEFGIDSNNIFALFDWVGGRYSSWSTIGLSLMCAIGEQHFRAFLSGGLAMDEHFFNAPFKQNIPVLMALIGIWYNTFYGAHSYAIIPYAHALRRLPAHIQQLDMESNGKQTGRYGEHLDFDTGPIIWGEEGVNCQHAFFQLLHQGSRLIPSDFIIPINSHYQFAEHQETLVSNAFAQTEALMKGKTAAEVLTELSDLPGIERDQLMPQKCFPGNQPSNSILIEKLTPFNMGQLLAMYEHKVFVQGIIWGINSFDQWGVEYGKVLAKQIQPELTTDSVLQRDSSTNGLIQYFRSHYKK
ncbi:glucose-6-phosphate isomerase [Neisseria sp. Ec49-e6-T10]|uniref:glucose-6-phosphate isomerase n=1 Tax=Neisseria sp. Ec49-e6-T10 TaxID=3140744 RepID=UPI003EB81E90